MPHAGRDDASSPPRLSPSGARRTGLVIIPAFNESARVGAVVEALRAGVPELDVLVVDDGSIDDTAARARACGALVLRHPFNLGYGAALQTGTSTRRAARRSSSCRWMPTGSTIRPMSIA